ncbi:hypothetical protein N0V95_005360 [Ascochyta clinopodiicola]|nr:hypothetical protein N0V95_005360 [Ascochyta clinopodiicola]
MAGRSIADAISLVEDDDEDENEAAYLANEVDVQGYDDVASEDDDEADYATVDDDDNLSAPTTAPRTHYPGLKDFELPSLSLDCGVIRPGSVVELQDRSGREPNAMRSGDFLLVRTIIESVETEEVGFEEIDIEEIVGMRKCLFSNLHFDLLGMKQANTLVPERLYKDLKAILGGMRPPSRELKAFKSWLLNKGTLICRWVHVIEVYDRKTGASYAGEVRRLYKREVADFSGSGNPVCSSTSDSKTPTPKPSPSTATTVSGVNDQANMETIYIPAGWLLKLRPRLFSMEQAPGLIKKAKHRLHFRRLLNDFICQGYNVRYRVQNQAWLGLAQQRRRLIFVGAKIGQPLPPFPQPEYGPPSSGLKRFMTIEDALRPLMRVENRLTNNKYHQKNREKKMNVPPINPHTTMANCITTSGGDNAHYSGQRAMTAMELAQLQGLGLQAQFAGSVTEAKKQCGNAWAPTSNKKYFLLCAATLEAYDNGLIKAEDDIVDLYDFLEQKSIKIVRPVVDLDDTSAFGGAMPAQPQYRYLSRLEKTVKPKIPLILWSRKAEVPHRSPRVRRAATTSWAGLDGTTDTRRSRTLSIRPRSQRTTQVEDENDDEVIFLASVRKRR